jgi:hypothetical protein
MSLNPYDLEAYLDEALPAAEMARVELALRAEADLRLRLASIHARRDAGVHTVGEIWRRHRLSCLPRHELGAYLLEALSTESHRYVEFHLQIVGCRYCLANLDDLRTQQDDPGQDAQTRRRKYFQSSAGYLRPS